MKKFKMGVVSSGQSLVDTTRDIATAKGIDISTAYAGLDAALEAADQMSSYGIEVLLARGGTAEILRNSIEIPVLSFPLSTIDILRCIKEATEFGRNILLVSYFKKMKGIEFVNELFNIRLTQSVCRNFDEMRALISSYHHRYDALVGGSTTAAVAGEFGLQAIETQTPEEAIESTLDSALSVARYNRIEQEKTRRTNLIINGVSDGVIAYDRSGKITLINDVAKKLLGQTDASPTEQTYQELLPTSKGLDAVGAGDSTMDTIERIGKDLFVFNHIPLLINEDVAGGVSTFKDASNVIAVENKIRRSMSKGLVAKYQLSDLICESGEMQEVVRRMTRFSQTNSTILIVGETGTGKELLAQSIHNLSPRAKEPFVSINCAALSDELLQSELFGYEEGAFTGSKKGGKAGMFELAHNGTIFLDEINTTSQNLQRHLLRVLQEREVMRLGADRITPINVRVIAASNKELISVVNNGMFREDLFFRLNMLNINLPPLRQRLEDIPLLVERFIHRLAIEYEKDAFLIPDTYIQLLCRHNWPGNIRQLRNFIARLLLICEQDFEPKVFQELYDELFDFKPTDAHRKQAASPGAINTATSKANKENVSEFDRIRNALEESNYNKTKAAELLGWSRTTLWKKLKKYQAHKES